MVIISFNIEVAQFLTFFYIIILLVLLILNINSPSNIKEQKPNIKNIDIKLTTNTTNKTNKKQNLVIQKLNMDINLFPFITPFRLIIAGPSGSGKTTFVQKLLDEKHILNPEPKHKIWFYAQYQSWYEKYPNITFIQGIPKLSFFKSNSSYLVVIDDLFQYLNKELTQLFACDSHHKNISVIFLTQNIFHKSAETRNISLNATHLVIFKNPRDQLQISHLGKQMFPGKSSYLVEVFKDATKKPFSYLLIDLTPEIDDQFRLRANIFIVDGFTRIYQ